LRTIISEKKTRGTRNTTTDRRVPAEEVVGNQLITTEHLIHGMEHGDVMVLCTVILGASEACWEVGGLRPGLGLRLGLGPAGFGLRQLERGCNERGEKEREDEEDEEFGHLGGRGS
jgi:hypothetical protein